MRCQSGGGVAATTSSPTQYRCARGSTARWVNFWAAVIFRQSPLRRAPYRRIRGGRKRLVVEVVAIRPAANLVCAPEPCTQQIGTEGFGGYVRRENQKNELIENRLEPVKVGLGMPFGLLKGS